MNAVLKPIEVRFETLTPDWLDALLQVEQQASAHPWTRRNFNDSLAAGYQVQLLLAGDTLLGYFVAMKGVDEVHLLNITVAPDYQRQGWAQVLLDALNGVVFRDDVQVVSLVARKRYAETPGLDVVIKPALRAEPLAVAT